MWKWMKNQKYTIYTVRSQPDNRNIQITGGRITEVQLYIKTLQVRLLIVELSNEIPIYQRDIMLYEKCTLYLQLIICETYS